MQEYPLVFYRKELFWKMSKNNQQKIYNEVFLVMLQDQASNLARNKTLFLVSFGKFNKMLRISFVKKISGRLLLIPALIPQNEMYLPDDFFFS